MFDKAIAELQAVANRSPSGNDKAKLGYVYAVAGKKEKAHEILNTLRKLPDRMYVSPYLVAAIYAGLNDKQQAVSAEQSLKIRPVKIAAVEELSTPGLSCIPRHRQG